LIIMPYPFVMGTIAVTPRHLSKVTQARTVEK
jgi:hypothetical protein